MNSDSKRARMGVIVPALLCAASLLITLLMLRNPRPTASDQPENVAAGEPPETSLAAVNAAEVLEQKWGVQATGLRLALGGNMLDFRYTILDPVKAGLLQKEEQTACLIDEATGAELPLPKAARAWSARRAPRQLALGSTYSLNFPNPDQHFKTGSKVTVVMGDFRAENLTVE